MSMNENIINKAEVGYNVENIKFFNTSDGAVVEVGVVKDHIRVLEAQLPEIVKNGKVRSWYRDFGFNSLPADEQELVNKMTARKKADYKFRLGLQHLAVNLTGLGLLDLRQFVRQHCCTLGAAVACGLAMPNKRRLAKVMHAIQENGLETWRVKFHAAVEQEGRQYDPFNEDRYQRQGESETPFTQRLGLHLGRYRIRAEWHEDVRYRQGGEPAMRGREVIQGWSDQLVTLFGPRVKDTANWKLFVKRFYEEPDRLIWFRDHRLRRTSVAMNCFKNGRFIGVMHAPISKPSQERLESFQALKAYIPTSFQKSVMFRKKGQERQIILTTKVGDAVVVKQYQLLTSESLARLFERASQYHGRAKLNVLVEDAKLLKTVRFESMDDWTSMRGRLNSEAGWKTTKV
jgi:hypothetical protein